jgi:putative colanic acid biosynthesis UDP-glucose lipid carrier transferase
VVSHRVIGIRSLTLFWQLVIVTVTFWGWLFIWQNAFLESPANFQRYSLYNEFLLIGILFGLGNKSEATGPKKEWVTANRKSLRQAGFGFFSVFLIVFALKDNWISRSFLFAYLPWLYASLLFTNLWLSRALEQWVHSGIREERVALVGSIAQVVRLQPWLGRKQETGVKTVGLICLEPSFGTPLPYPVWGTLDELENKLGEILNRQAVTQLIILDMSLGGERLRHLTHLCDNAAVRMMVLHDLNSYFNHATTIFEDNGTRFIGLREEPLENPMNRLWKRALDLAVALPVVVLILPFTSVLIWVLHRLYSPGPLLFGQRRNGMLGRSFRIYKYRTMHVSNPDESRQAKKDDDRVFPAGAWLRKTSIDELPQFINVLLGDMSIVGPRPHMPAHDELFAKVMRNYLIRQLIRPGITGWAQANGFRGEIQNEKDVQNRVEADIYYLEHWSFSLDCLIILKTAMACISPPRSAY